MESPSSTLSVTALSSNPGLVPNQAANLNVSGTGNIRTLNITPVAGVAGSASITVTASDGVLSSSRIFVLNMTNPLSDRQTWWNQKFGSPDPGVGPSAATADPDGDGLNNILEYALGGEPLVADATGRFPTFTKEAAGFFLTYGPVRNSVVYDIEVSSDLSSGWSLSTNLNRTTNQSGTITVHDPLGIPLPAKKFYRLNISVP